MKRAMPRLLKHGIITIDTFATVMSIGAEVLSIGV
jgi:hypothetical protein